MSDRDDATDSDINNAEQEDIETFVENMKTVFKFPLKSAEQTALKEYNDAANLIAALNGSWKNEQRKETLQKILPSLSLSDILFLHENIWQKISDGQQNEILETGLSFAYCLIGKPYRKTNMNNFKHFESFLEANITFQNEFLSTRFALKRKADDETKIINSLKNEHNELMESRTAKMNELSTENAEFKHNHTIILKHNNELAEMNNTLTEKNTLLSIENYSLNAKNSSFQEQLTKSNKDIEIFLNLLNSEFKTPESALKTFKDSRLTSAVIDYLKAITTQRELLDEEIKGLSKRNNELEKELENAKRSETLYDSEELTNSESSFTTSDSDELSEEENQIRSFDPQHLQEDSHSYENDTHILSHETSFAEADGYHSLENEILVSKHSMETPQKQLHNNKQRLGFSGIRIRKDNLKKNASEPRVSRFSLIKSTASVLTISDEEKGQIALTPETNGLISVETPNYSTPLKALKPSSKLPRFGKQIRAQSFIDNNRQISHTHKESIHQTNRNSVNSSNSNHSLTTPKLTKSCGTSPLKSNLSSHDSLLNNEAADSELIYHKLNEHNLALNQMNRAYKAYNYTNRSLILRAIELAQIDKHQSLKEVKKTPVFSARLLSSRVLWITVFLLPWFLLVMMMYLLGTL